MKIRLFLTTVESGLLHGTETWTLTKALRKQLDGCYTRMLRMAMNVSWKSQLTNNELYGEIPKVSTKVQQRRMRIEGHYIRHSEEMTSKLVLWEPTERRTRRGRRRFTYIDALLEDTGMVNVQELRAIMQDRSEWRKRVQGVGRPNG